jgi:hypothetical protein
VIQIEKGTPRREIQEYLITKKIMSEQGGAAKPQKTLHVELSDQIRVVCNEYDRIEDVKQFSEKMASMFIQHGGKVMDCMWGLNGDNSYDVVGDLHTDNGHSTSVKSIMCKIIDEILKQKSQHPQVVEAPFLSHS